MLRLEKIRKGFDALPQPVIKSLSLEIPDGQFCVIIGSNGSGKSTLMRLIQGEYELDHGRIFLGDHDVSKLPLYKRSNEISMVSQDMSVGIVQEMSLLENLALSRMRGQKASFGFFDQDQNFYLEKIKSLGVGLEKYIDQPLKGLSGGQKQMIAFLMALLNTPKLLILDEHCSALDPKSSVMLMEKSAEMVKELELTSLMITHNLKDALAYGDRLIMMHQGEIVEDFNAAQKAKLTMKELLDLFHYYEDLTYGVGEGSPHV